MFYEQGDPAGRAAFLERVCATHVVLPASRPPRTGSTHASASAGRRRGTARTARSPPTGSPPRAGHDDDAARAHRGRGGARASPSSPPPPTWRPPWRPPEGAVFTGTFFYQDDLYQYLSFVEQASRGARGLCEQVRSPAASPGGRERRVVVGRRAGPLLGDSPVLGFHALRVPAIVAMVAGAARLLAARGSTAPGSPGARALRHRGRPRLAAPVDGHARIAGAGRPDGALSVPPVADEPALRRRHRTLRVDVRPPPGVAGRTALAVGVGGVRVGARFLAAVRPRHLRARRARTRVPAPAHDAPVLRRGPRAGVDRSGVRLLCGAHVRPARPRRMDRGAERRPHAAARRVRPRAAPGRRPRRDRSGGGRRCTTPSASGARSRCGRRWWRSSSWPTPCRW